MSVIKTNRNRVELQNRSLLKIILAMSILVTLTMSFNIEMNPTIYVKQPSFSYKIQCKDFSGSVTFKVDGLPQGIQTNGDTLIVTKNGVKAGYYPIRVTAQDSKGLRDERIVVLIVTNDIVSLSAVQASEDSISSVQSSQSSQSNTQRTTIVSTTTSNNNIISTSSTPSDINSILSRYGSQAILNERTTVINAQLTDKYPTANFPTEKDPTSVNTERLNILTANVKFSDNDKNTITVNDITKNIILERSISAQKSVANLLSIIEQSKANRNSAFAQIQIYKAQYNAAIQNQRKVQTDIIQGENSVQKLNVAINGAQTELKNLQNRLKMLQDTRKELMSRIQINRNTIVKSQDSIKKLNIQLLKRKQEVKNLQLKLSKDLTYKDSVTKKLLQTQGQFNQIKGKFDKNSNDRQQSKTKIDNLQNSIDDLEAKLVYARNQLSAEKQQFQKFVSFENTAPEVLATLNNKINSFRNQIQQLDFSITKYTADIRSNTNDVIAAIEAELKKLNDLIKKSEQQIRILTIRINDQVDVPSQVSRQKYSQTQSDLTYLKSQVEIFNQNLRKLYIQGNDANTRVINSKQNLDAIIIREQKQRNITKQATLNLQKARAEKELADLAVQELIASRTEALPYSIVPNGNGRTNAGTPTGNNPSGSPLGSLSNNGGYMGGYFIKDWTHYLSQAFGDGVHPAFANSVNALFPFKISDNLRSFNSNDGFPCQSKGQSLESLDGTIISYDNNNIVAIDNKGYKNTIQLAPCTTVLANVESYKPQIGDLIVWKGMNEGMRSWKTEQVTCLRK